MKNTHTSSSHPLRIDSVQPPGVTGHIGMTICPGKQGPGITAHWERSLEEDLDVIHQWGALAVVTLMEQHELQLLNVLNLPSYTRNLGIQWHHLPIRDVDIPDQRFNLIWPTLGKHLQELLEQGGKVLLHCRGGLGRTGMVAALLLKRFGVDPTEAVRMVRQARPGTIETTAQEHYVKA